MKRKQREPWPPIELLLPNLDELERLSRGEEPLPDLQQLELVFDESEGIGKCPRAASAREPRT